MTVRLRRGTISLALVLTASAALREADATAATPAAASPASAAQLHAWQAGDDPGALDAWVHSHMRHADEEVARLVAVKGARTVANTLRPYDDANNELFLAQAQAQVLYGVGTTKA